MHELQTRSCVTVQSHKIIKGNIIMTNEVKSTKVKRYDLKVASNGDGETVDARMSLIGDGVYVDYSDYEKLEHKLALSESANMYKQELIDRLSEAESIQANRVSELEHLVNQYSQSVLNDVHAPHTLERIIKLEQQHDELLEVLKILYDHNKLYLGANHYTVSLCEQALTKAGRWVI